MITHVNATFVNGMLKPDEALPLAEQSRVRLTIESFEDWSQGGASKAWEALKARLRAHPICGRGRRFTRDELHERR
jgi:hypothetical protein